MKHQSRIWKSQGTNIMLERRPELPEGKQLDIQCSQWNLRFARYPDDSTVLGIASRMSRMLLQQISASAWHRV
jgi:hypothetical protein